MTAEWHYYGHYGEIGPLTLDQIQELIEAGVISSETLVWRPGMSNWAMAGSVKELAIAFAKTNRPPPVPPVPSATSPGPVRPPAVPLTASSPAPAKYPLLESDKSRVAGGVLNLVLPGVGRIYLGYAAIGVLQLVLSLCGVGAIWAWIDGIIILTGGVRLDGYGRELKD